MSCRRGIEDFPDELLLKIFSYLTTEELVLRLPHVTHSWDILSQDSSLWEQRCFEPRPQTTDKQIIQVLRKTPKLKYFSSTRGMKSKLFINTLCLYCPQICELSFHRRQILAPRQIKKLHTHLPNLQSIKIGLHQTKAKMNLKVISLFNNLKTLQISDLELCAEGVVRPIAESCPCLEHVDLGHESESDEIRHEDLVYLLEHKKADLKTMTITYNDWSEHTRALFEQCTQLEELHIYSWNNTRESNLTFIGKPTNLCALSLRQMSHFESSLSHLLQNYDWSNLTKLDLANHYNLGNESLSCIYQNCANIEYLCVEMCENLTDEGFEHISKCKNLYHLNVSFCYELTDQTIQHIAKCTKLRYLNTEWCKCLTDKAIANIALFFEMRILVFDSCNFTGHNFELLSKNLQKLSVKYCDNLQEDKLTKLQLSRASLQIITVLNQQHLEQSEEEPQEGLLEGLNLFQQHEYS